MTKAQRIRCAWYDVYLYLIMMFEGTYRHYETNDQYVWVHGLFEKVWEEMEVQNQMKNIIPETVQTAQGAMSYIYAATGNKFIVIIDEWDVLIRDEAGKVHECVIQNYFK